MRIDPSDIANALGLPLPTPEQAAVISGSPEPTLVVAGAGAGKTETMAARVVWLVASGLALPSEVLGLTFTRKAAQQLSRRIRKRLDALARSPLCTGPGVDPAIADAIRSTDPQISTYHAYAGTLLSSYGLLLPVEPNARLLSPTEVFQLAYDVVSRWESPLSSGSSVGRVTEQVLALAGQLSDHLVTTTDLREHPDEVTTLISTLPPGPRQSSEPVNWLLEVATTQSYREELADIADAVAERMKAEAALDYGSQMSLAATLARDHAAVGEAERRASPVVLLDEYQDTGHSQRVLLSSLFGAAGGFDGAGGESRRQIAVTAVGDPLQSIYGWRGASASNLDRFRTDFPGPGGSPAKVLELTTSWRNPPQVLKLANQVTAPLRAGAVEVKVPELKSKPQAGNADIALGVFDTVAEEREWLATSIAARYREIEVRGAIPTAAVLVRRNADAVPLAEAIRKQGLEVEVVGVGGLLSVPEVADVLALLTVVAHPGAGPELLRLLTGSRFALGAADLASLRRRASELSLRKPGAAVSGAISDTEALEAIFDEISGAEDVDSAGLADALADPGAPTAYSAGGRERIAELAGIIGSLRARTSAPPARLAAAAESALGLDAEVRVREATIGGEGREHLDAFHAVAASYGSGVAASLEGFLAYLRSASEIENGLPKGEAVARPGRVQILTVHAAKGLEWEIVAVPHVSVKVFPGERSPDNALRTPSQIPDGLRGDRESAENPGGAPIPRLDNVHDRKQLEAALKAHIGKVKDRSTDEDRRLFYVALTRSERVLLVSSSYWEDAGSTSRGPSDFFQEISDQCQELDPATGAPVGRTEQQCQSPSESNPLTAVPREGTWPGGLPEDSATQRQRAVAQKVASAVGIDPGAATDPDLLSKSEHPVAGRWFREAAALLEERRRESEGVTQVQLPRRLSASEVVALGTDPEAFSARLRRPVPYKPDRFARRGTRFHTWLEHRFGATHLLELDDLPGAGDEELSDADLVGLQEAFERSHWATLTPVGVEVPFEVSLGQHLLRGRMDAVFASGDGWIVVDWKTGAVPSESALPAVSLQLAVYRYAWSRIVSARTGQDVPLEKIRAAFHYVRPNRTLEPGHLPDAAQLAEVLDLHSSSVEHRNK